MMYCYIIIINYYYYFFTVGCGQIFETTALGHYNLA